MTCRHNCSDLFTGERCHASSPTSPFLGTDLIQVLGSVFVILALAFLYNSVMERNLTVKSITVFPVSLLVCTWTGSIHRNSEAAGTIQFTRSRFHDLNSNDGNYIVVCGRSYI